MRRPKFSRARSRSARSSAADAPPKSVKTALADKHFFKIGEAAELVGVKTHVLRYWESEFPSLRPMKTRGSHRMYRREDVELACVIRRLLHEEGYSIPGAKKHVRELVAQKNTSTEGPPSLPGVSRRAARELGLRAELIQLRGDLVALLASLEPKAGSALTAEPGPRATVTAVVPKTALIQQRMR